MIAATNTPVENSTAPQNNGRIGKQIRERVARFENASPREITYRLAELDQEWDVERALEMNFSGVVIAGIAMGTVSNRKWFLLPTLAACFMVQHVVGGWCPPLAALRRLGFRTAAEINRERTALKILRGDFADFGVLGIDQASAPALLDAIEGYA